MKVLIDTEKRGVAFVAEKALENQALTNVQMFLKLIGLPFEIEHRNGYVAVLIQEKK